MPVSLISKLTPNTPVPTEHTQPFEVYSCENCVGHSFAYLSPTTSPDGVLVGGNTGQNSAWVISGKLRSSPATVDDAARSPPAATAAPPASGRCLNSSLNSSIVQRLPSTARKHHWQPVGAEPSPAEMRRALDDEGYFEWRSGFPPRCALVSRVAFGEQHACCFHGMPEAAKIRFRSLLARKMLARMMRLYADRRASIDATFFAGDVRAVDLSPLHAVCRRVGALPEDLQRRTMMFV